VFKPYTAFIGLRYTRSRQRSRLVSFISLVSIAGLALGVGLLITVLSVMNGFDREMQQRILGLVSHLNLVSYQPVDNWQALAERAETHPGVIAAAPYVALQGMWVGRGRTTPTRLQAVDPVAERRVSIIAEHMVDGSLDSLSGQASGVVISQFLARKLGVSTGQKLTLVIPESSNRGQRVLPRMSRFTVVGVYHTGTELDNALALTGLKAGSELAGHAGKVRGLRLKLDDIFLAPEIGRQLAASIAPGRLYSRHWGQTHGNLYHAIQLSRRLVGILLFMIIAVAAFNVISTLIMVVRDKQGDIAILRAMGSSPRQIMTVFMVQGSLIGVIGTVAGVLIGIAFSLTITDLVAAVETVMDIQFLKADVYPVSYLPADLRGSDILLVSAVALGMSFLATLYPSWRAARTQPAEVLRHE
jgi:lipoprotein-releasing system permease protein